VAVSSRVDEAVPCVCRGVAVETLLCLAAVAG
jgi:hypothetical protein